ncbi:hypothetical protein [Gelidibacter mesophilus]|uniref:hypothetical protein n=1 Tax=Gelidibacter mesophilus TaxID=169050 RepID=UPI0004813B53|nr:hypothetical protein [Gelidibacter mesophilus]
MKKSISLVLGLTAVLLFSGCSSVKVMNSWKGDNAAAVKDKNFIVIARTSDTQSRIAFENEIVKQLSEKGMKATASFTKFPSLNPDVEVTEERKAEIESTIKKAGFNAVVLTVIKDVQNLTKTTQEGGYYAGGNYYEYYPRYYGGFYGYYHHPMSYSTMGNYVPETYVTSSSKNYILETVIYDLDETNENQLVAVVTSKIEDPEGASKIASQYVKAITKSFENK